MVSALLIEEGMDGRAVDRSELRASLARILRWPAAFALALHGVAHAVFAVRGFGAVESAVAGRMLGTLLWAVPMLGFVAYAGGLAGAHGLRKLSWTFLVAIAVFSTLMILRARDADLMVGLAGNALIAGCGLAFHVGDVPTPKPGQPLPPPAVPVVPHGWRRALGVARDACAWGALTVLAALALTRPFHRTWGTTAAERAEPLAGETAQRYPETPAFEVNHGVTIAAPPEAVWPYLVQLGQDRAGFYSYAWLENLLGLRVTNADRVHPEWQSRAVGDLVRATPPGWAGGLFGDDLGWRVEALEPARLLKLHLWGSFELDPVAAGTRMLVRSKTADRRAPLLGSVFTFLAFDAPHFIMERKMLLTIKDLAERDAASAAVRASND